MVDSRSVLIGLHESAGLGWKRIAGIIERDDEWHYAYNFGSTEWMERGLSAELAIYMERHFTKSWIEERIELTRSKGIEIITYMDEDYPILMKETARPPWVMYVIGHKMLLSTLSVAMVGTRVPTAYGRKVGAMLTEGLCEHNVTIVSGLARGIDGICHEAALKCGGSTIAVLGTAIDVAYPPDHMSLYRMIANQGLIVSEYPIGTKAHPGLFPQRNRIIAGLSRGTVVVEADLRSGSLITADAAMEADRDVFAVPGPITSPKSRGAIELIKQGAIIVSSADDILKEYHLLNQTGRSLHNHDAMNPELTETEWRIYHMLEQGSRSFDELLSLTKWEFGLLHSVLLSLIIKKQTVQLPGSIYKLI